MVLGEVGVVQELRNSLEASLPSLDFAVPMAQGTSWVWNNNAVRMSNVLPIKSFGMSLKGESSDWGEQGLL